MLGRTGPQIHLRRHPHRSQTHGRLLQHARTLQQNPPGRNDQGNRLPRHARDVHLPRRILHRRIRLRPGPNLPRRAGPRLHSPRQERRGRLRAGLRHQKFGRVRRLLRHSVSVAQVGHGGDSRVRHGGDGELGIGHVSGGGSADRSHEGVFESEAEGLHGRDARVGTSVVWESCYDDLVGRSLAQRRLRILGRKLGRRRRLPRLGNVGPVHHRPPLLRDATRRAQIQPPHPGAHPPRRGGRGGLRRHLLLQGRERREDGARRARDEGVSKGPRELHEEARVREHRNVRPVEGVGGEQRDAGAGDDGELDVDHGIPPRDGDGGEVGEGAGDVDPRAGVVFVRWVSPLGGGQEEEVVHPDPDVHRRGDAEGHDLHERKDGDPGHSPAVRKWVGEVECGSGSSDARQAHHRNDQSIGRGHQVPNSPGGGQGGASHG
mmetsp:Transcript_42218/g.88663  ORF Transcript_42218/g.88663 Transcript_42218/m.88663 type:complete len:433 (-) Transcript_42218:1083-2381(-)